MRVCILGAGGMLGSDLLAVLGSDSVVGLTRAEADVTDAPALRATLERIRPEALVNCAAYTKVDDCETQREHAFAVNGTGAGNVAAACAAVGARLVHVSTDYVFDGTATVPIPEDAPPHPIGVYGESKLAGERAVQEHLPDALIVRTAWLYGRGGPNFVDTMLRLAAERDTLTVVNDQRGAPTSTRDLAQAIAALLQHDVTGPLHVTNSGDCTWFEFARFIFAHAGLSHVEVRPTTTTEFGRPAPRPAYSVLDCSRYVSVAGTPLRSWQEALVVYLEARRGTAAPSAHD